MEEVSCQYCNVLHSVPTDCMGFWCSCGTRIERDLNTQATISAGPVLETMSTNQESWQRPSQSRTSPPPPPLPARPTLNGTYQIPRVTIVNLETQHGQPLPTAPAFSPDSYSPRFQTSSQNNASAPLAMRSGPVNPVTAIPSSDKNLTSSNSNQNNKLEKSEAKSGNENSTKQCQSCHKPFSLISRWKHSCKSCGLSVCGTCSRGKWPSQMLPVSQNTKNEKALRVCTACQTRMESFRKALLTGNVTDVKEIYDSGIVQLYYPYQIYPHRQYPVHCAALSGSIECFSWLISKGCHPSIQDARGLTPLALAAKSGHHQLVKYMIFRGVAEIREVTNVEALQKCLQSAMIELQQKEIELSMKRHIEINIPNPVDTSAYPKSTFEEEAQLKLAMDLSMSETGSNAGALYSSNHGYESDSDEGKFQDEDCVICFERKIDCVIVPCGHMSCCQECTTQFKECPVCRTEIKQVVRTFKT